MKRWDFRWLLALAFGLLLGMLFLQRGIVDHYDDSKRFVQLAAAIPDHFPPDAHARWYTTYALTVKLLWQPNAMLLYLVQGAVAMTALLVLVTLVDRHLGRRNAWLAGGLFLLAADWHVFHLSLMSDSLAVSCSLLCLLGWSYGSFRAIWWWGLPLVAYTLLLRPTTWALLPAVAAWTLVRMPTGPWRAAGAGVALVAAIGLGNLLLGSTNWLPTHLAGETIFGWDEGRIAPPPDLFVPPAQAGPIWQYLQLWAQASGWNLQLVGTKLFLCLTGWRPYYSALHNGLTVGYQVSLLVLGLWGLLRAPRPVAALLGMFLLAHLLANALLSVDWENRFWFPALPVLSWLAAYALLPPSPDLPTHAAPPAAHLA